MVNREAMGPRKAMVVNKGAMEVSKGAMEVVSNNSRKTEGMEVANSRVIMVVSHRVVMLEDMVLNNLTVPVPATILKHRDMLNHNLPILILNLLLHRLQGVMLLHLLLVALLVEPQHTRIQLQGIIKVSRLLLVMQLVHMDRLNHNNMDKTPHMLNHQHNSTHRDRVTRRLLQAMETLLLVIDSEFFIIPIMLKIFITIPGSKGISTCYNYLSQRDYLILLLKDVDQVT